MRMVEARVEAVRRWWGWPPVGLFLGTRVVTSFVAWLAYVSSGSSSYIGMLTSWDAFWYHRIADQGYGELPVGGMVLHPLQSYAFFPVVPMAARGVHLVTGLSVATSGVVVSMAGGLVGTVALWKLIQRRFGAGVASDSVLLMLVAPFAFVFSLFYTEGPALLAVALCFLALDRKRWFWAGVAAVAAGLIRPNGFLLFVPCAVAAILAVRNDREWKALLAPALAPLGFLAWMGVVAARTGELTGYFTLQRQGLGATVDFGVESGRGIVELLTFQWGTAGRVLNAAALLVGALGLVLAVRRRLDPTWIAYAAAVIVVTAVNQNQASGGRYLLLAFPIFVAFALAIPKRAYPVVVAMSAVAMGGVFYTVLMLDLTP